MTEAHTECFESIRREEETAAGMEKQQGNMKVSPGSQMGAGILGKENSVSKATDEKLLHFF